MKTKIILFAFGLIAVFLMFAGNISAQNRPSESVVIKNGRAFTGTAEFKFAIVSDTTSLWSNDGSSKDASEPLTSCSIPVSEGIYSFEIGEKPMKPFFYELLNLYGPAMLITWVNTGDGFKLLKREPLSKAQITDNSNATTVTSADGTDPSIKKDNPIAAKQFLAESKAEVYPEEENENADNPGGIQEEQRMKRSDASGQISFGALYKAKKQNNTKLK